MVRSYIEKMSEDCDRIKFRLRSYSSTHVVDILTRVELKVRKANRVEKYSTFVQVDELKYFMEHRFEILSRGYLDP